MCKIFLKGKKFLSRLIVVNLPCLVRSKHIKMHKIEGENIFNLTETTFFNKKKKNEIMKKKIIIIIIIII
jgi:hypothetical protein